METKYLGALLGLVIIIGVYGVLTMQLLVAVFLIAVIVALFFLVSFLFSFQQSLDRIEQRLEALVKK
jgi:uncharacterized membrane protein